MFCGVTLPLMPVATPDANKVAMEPGEIPAWKPPALTKLLEVNAGPGCRTVRLNVVEKVPDVAVMTTAPVFAPAVIVVEAVPSAPVVTLGVAIVALPDDTVKVIGTLL